MEEQFILSLTITIIVNCLTDKLEMCCYKFCMCLEVVPVTIYYRFCGFISVDLSLINLISNDSDLSVIKPDKDNTDGIYVIVSQLFFLNIGKNVCVYPTFILLNNMVLWKSEMSVN